VVLAAVAVLMLLALLTYHPQDLSWSSAGPEHAPSNLIGRFGAYLSDSFLQLFGLASFLIPILFAVIAYRALFGAHSGLPVAKSVGAGLLLIAISGFLALFPQIGLSVLKNARNGGVVGFLVENVLAQVMNTAGAAIILVSASLLTLMLTMEVSLASGWETLVVFSRSLRHHGQPTTSSEESKPGIPERKAVTGRPNPIVAAFARLGSWWTSRTEIRRERQRQRSVTRNLRESEARELPEDADDGIVSRARPLSRSDRNRASKSDQGANGGADPGRTLPTSPGPVMPQSPIVGAEALEDADLDVDGVVSRAHPIVSKRADVPAIGTQEVQQSSQSQALPAPGSSSRQEAQEAIRARNARRLQEPEDRDITMDPDVAEMVSTASIVRTIPGPIVPGAGSGAPAEKTERRKVPPRGAAESTYKLPPLDLMEPPIGHHEQAEEELRERATILAEKCKEFSVTGHIHRINPGPVVTTFEFKPDPGVKYSRVVSLADDLCLALKAESIRIDRIPGKSTVGIEVPNAKREMIHLREVIESSKFQKSDTRLAIALGKTINGEEYVADLAKMPHLLIAGATGAGKSVTLNAIICSILYKASAEDVKLIMVDPKRLELGLYEGIPHLLTPIVTEPKRAANALKWAVNEMENRYRELAKFGVRNIDQYNRHIRENPNPTLFDEDPNAPKQLPYIVITIDELADL
ncbi:MAG TPA: DNA translocase FtsK 4TM domain-containing protein, partial [Blastocatellia bacterium]|nr:DNA translocase FtsK 4TM domain-containing protein [Blastocatellia bacterium]